MRLAVLKRVVNRQQIKLARYQSRPSLDYARFALTNDPLAKFYSKNLLRTWFKFNDCKQQVRGTAYLSASAEFYGCLDDRISRRSAKMGDVF